MEVRISLSVLLIGVVLLGCNQEKNVNYTFSENQKAATEFTKTQNATYYEFLDFDDKSAFERVDRGFIAPLINEGNIEGVFDATGFNFMQDKEPPASVNPSLWRHAQLVNRGGLYKVTDNIYQVRGQDLVNLTIIETKNGIILYDVEYTAATLASSIKLYEQHRGKKKLKGVIISHSHADHFGGFAGIYDAGLATPEDFSSGRIPLIAPLNFVEKSVSENVMAGNIMARRAGYQYGNVLKPGEKGLITGALGAALANGASSLPIPNKIISKEEGENLIIDGLNFEFYFTPSAEAPAELVFYIPEWKALSMAEEVNHLQHNIYTLRGAETRDAKLWASYIADVIARFGNEVEVQFGPHTWPVWGNEEVVSYLKDQRDLYQSIYNTTLRYANYGYRPNDIAEFAELPKSVFNSWNNRPYYGQTANNLKSTYVKNLGWYNANPTELASYPDSERGKRYVKAMGGEGAVLETALDFFDEGDYRFTVDILNNIISYTATNTKANLLMADAFEQLGYQEENALYRNWYLSAANELRVGGNVPNNLSTTSPEVIASLPTELLMEYLGMLADQIKAEQMGNYSINLNLTNEVPYNLDLHNGVLNALKDYSDPSSDVAISVLKADFINYLYGKVKLDELTSSKKIKIEGNSDILTNLRNVIDLTIKNNMNLVLPLQKENKIN
ncbi:Alkyl sulfatase BDS1, metallo-beta-lactamase superfamily [Hyunsoonleella jejuensis]|uniref:Alkyl sulfatase BDS1, metallo-beta-lactamase superfamily n=1 Tax=Hyunsoonleella jejuensis TaxID=419940 RepID=A0A1H9DSZ9_9FLAO|nr:alkyl sulfatase dimerization domain-containing protein [Hyunsoonleella jejuensis]SEQ15883.1 Alkyl sulfatase BDS1, metallo-beta-lactamase superfamily [Hyunsoonleella jejuensis]